MVLWAVGNRMLRAMRAKWSGLSTIDATDQTTPETINTRNSSSATTGQPSGFGLDPSGSDRRVDNADQADPSA